MFKLRLVRPAICRNISCGLVKGIKRVMSVKEAKFLLAVISQLSTVRLSIKLPSADAFTYVFSRGYYSLSHLNAQVIKINRVFAQERPNERTKSKEMKRKGSKNERKKERKERKGWMDG